MRPREVSLRVGMKEKPMQFVGEIGEQILESYSSHSLCLSLPLCIICGVEASRNLNSHLGVSEKSN